jgi:hypothetical protein
MANRLEVKVSDQTGLPYTEVPQADMWELVEYLSFQRVAVSYEYRAVHFTVCFLRSDVATAQRLLDDWAKLGSTVLQEAV